MAFDKAKKEEVREVGKRPWNIEITPEHKPIYKMHCLVIIGTEVTVSKSHYIDDQGSELREGTKGVIKEVRITADKIIYSILFEEVYWVFEDMGGAYGSVESSSLWFTVEKMDELGIKIEGREVK
ncbi:hypothetical protein SHANETTE_196 [Bacillus phage Shanette]|uniref:Uncharacterized protein n=1 Tax=Bacillus phage Shanette TaxID=1296656 RepID=S5M992_9CAUD|nr:hypothetical protein AVV46_gp101 [Bacillus phage Shanette]AGR47088.1 hypothetical protein SHANETTE_196 [Bacillus phage Shanette]